MCINIVSHVDCHIHSYLQQFNHRPLVSIGCVLSINAENSVSYPNMAIGMGRMVFNLAIERQCIFKYCLC